ncbi:LacI family transcriptional regulator [Catellatospora methionotrophica]|uniref:LacI family transcriptional regulator n=1 Tax=Catellatospora methionotrophica TaxID=121620 RepID=A0A8J3LH42_9ACTN|nr:LacI family DNA-binding transcriptional regulator [Catellatospora methionotrophica]GIG15081.1 LacI family transcriptional regulator [Catellatospora methionotrophica]
MASANSTAQRVTIRDVASVAGVSTATVSKVLNDRPDVGPEVRQRVLDTIARLGYRPNAVARGLRARHTDTIAILTDDLEGIFTNALMRGVEDAASAYDVSVLLANSYGDPDRERKHLRRLLDRQMDGLIIMSGNRVRPRSGPALPLPATPYVFLYEYAATEPVPSILPDDRGGAVLAAQHLLDIGRRRIGFINGPASWEATADRLDGLTATLAAAGAPLRPALIRHAASWSPQDGYALATELLDAPEPPDAIFGASDDLATGALAAIHERGLRIPEDVAVVGFDDRSLAVHQRPPLTTVALPLLEMGRVAGQRLLEAVNGGQQRHELIRVPCELRVRASTVGAGHTPR